jgi:ferredoxin
MRIEADRIRCKGHGQCELFAPGYFEVDDDALVVVLTDTVKPDDLSAVQEAVAHCPEVALKLVED